MVFLILLEMILLNNKKKLPYLNLLRLGKPYLLLKREMKCIQVIIVQMLQGEHLLIQNQV
jgi:hypothetical protein